MRKLNVKQKMWHDAHSKKKLKLKTKYNKKRKNCRYQSKYNLNRNHSPHILIAPRILNVIENCEETLKFFADAEETIKKCKLNDKIYFNLKNIEIISVDAIMYLIAMICNYRRIRALRIVCEGNFPQNDKAKEVIEKSGFYRFVSTGKSYKNVKTDKTIQITSGKEADPQTASKVCDFIASSLPCTLIATKKLYAMIIELMTNTKQHAYNNTEKVMDDKWYFFAENIETGKVKFVFLDTGVGIPKTVKKKFWESISSAFRNDDAKLIAAALSNEYNRSETKKLYRGKGLPGIYDNSVTRYISDLIIVSGQGMCVVDKYGVISTRRITSKLLGTMFCWTISI